MDLSRMRKGASGHCPPTDREPSRLAAASMVDPSTNPRVSHSLRTRCGRGPSAVVRLGWRWDRAVEVCFCAVKSRAVSNRNCVVATRGGEQRNENDQSVTQVVQWDSRGELDSVGVDGRAFDRLAKPVERARGASRIAGQPGGPRSSRRWLEMEWPEAPTK
jgi:hypothetical protein